MTSANANKSERHQSVKKTMQKSYSPRSDDMARLIKADNENMNKEVSLFFICLELVFYIGTQG